MSEFEKGIAVGMFGFIVLFLVAAFSYGIGREEESRANKKIECLQR